MTADVTLILTTHNRPRMFREAYRSAVRTGARVLVVDDGSRPRYADADLRLEQSVGYSYARIAALPAVTTEYLAFLDDDDVLGPDWLPLSLDRMAEGCDVVAASYVETNETLRPLRTFRLRPASLSGLMAGECPINDGALIRRDVLDGIQWHPERDTVMMYSLWLALAAKGARFGVTAEPCWYHRLHGSNMSSGIGEQDAAWRAEARAEFAA